MISAVIHVPRCPRARLRARAHHARKVVVDAHFPVGLAQHALQRLAQRGRHLEFGRHEDHARVGAHHSTGWPSEYHGKMPRRYASMRREGSRSALAASSPARRSRDRARVRWAETDRPGRARDHGAGPAVAQRAEDIAGVHAVVARGAIGEEESQGLADGRERDFVPRDVGFVEQLHFEAFLAGLERRIGEPREVEQVNLVHVRHVEQREQVLHLDARAGFLERFARGGFGRRLAHFHEARGQRPEPVARFDRAAAQQDLIAPDRNRADDVARILVVDRAAVIADEALAVVARRNARDDFVTADGAEFHVEWKGRGDASVSPGRGILERLRVQAACRAKRDGA